MRIFACDLSLNHPGIAVLDFDEDTSAINLLVAETFSPNPKASHGERLSKIYTWLAMRAALYAPTDYVRERAFSRFAHETQALNKVVGIADLVAWDVGTFQYRRHGHMLPSIVADDHAVFNEIAPTKVKKLLTGEGTASKDEVANALKKYVGEYEYDTDNASDATAVALAWLLQSGKIKEKTDDGVDGKTDGHGRTDGTINMEDEKIASNN